MNSYNARYGPFPLMPIGIVHNKCSIICAEGFALYYFSYYIVMYAQPNFALVYDSYDYILQQCLPHWCGSIYTCAAMEIVGGFLGDLLHHSALPQRSIKVFRPVKGSTHFTDGSQFLHCAPNYKQSQLVRLIISICDGVPESFEVFRCQTSTSQEQLGLFLERVEKQPLRYLIMEVNELPFTLQEVKYVLVM